MLRWSKRWVEYRKSKQRKGKRKKRDIWVQQLSPSHMQIEKQGDKKELFFTSFSSAPNRVCARRGKRKYKIRFKKVANINFKKVL